ncbi:MAG TPA: hypothetical protein DCL15_08425 [Chloroflexi bacterium]|nr:hypothetical protein [Chloroflexota bacterium]HHW86343.1 hypothetical protein [Chloroflexota bacterium]
MVGVVRDILIIFLALTSIVVWVLLGILIWQIWRLTKLVQSELKPMIVDTKETIATVRGTAAFMSENVVTPVIQTSSRVAGYRRTAMALFGQLPRTPTSAAPRSNNSAFTATAPVTSAPPPASDVPTS